MERDFLERPSDLGPREIKDEFIKPARAGAEKALKPFLNAGCGNPNRIATPARKPFFPLGQRALAKAKRAGHEPSAFVQPLTAQITGENAPVPDRAPYHKQTVTDWSLIQAMGTETMYRPIWPRKERGSQHDSSI